MGLFGTSGVRGVVGDEITPELGLEIGAAVGKDADEVTVGRDTRVTGKALEDAVVAGVLSQGADVRRLGVATTPTTARLTRDSGIVITASHNPPEYNGFKPWNSDGTAYDVDQRARVEDLVESGLSPVEPTEFGDSEEIDGSLRRHADEVLDAVGESTLKVVVDGGCGAASWITPHVLREMGCEVVTLNCQYDGNFPARLPEPTAENLEDLQTAVESTDADLGVAHDGDGDRMAAVDENGEYVEPDRLMALFARNEDADTVVAPLNTSLVVDQVAEVVRTQVGDVHVAQKLKETGGDFGGEPSCSWIFPDETYCPDGVLAAAKVVDLVSDSSKSLSQLSDSLPSYTVRRANFDCPDDSKDGVMSRVAETAESEYGDYTDIDGVRVETDKGWFLIRPSGTEPLIRLNAESGDEDDADYLFESAKEILRDALEAESETER
ncbi:MAG: phosphoglucosamine mutase [Halobacteria archaeon]|nr:phosphoglucosamine mutase [Halobacteria archaeon]